jgi:hypothetical protein
MTRQARWTTCCALCALLAAAGASAQEMELEVVPYLWGSGIEGPVGIGNRTADVDASFSNILSHLHFAAMGLADARRDKFVVLTDVIYTDLRGQRATDFTYQIVGNAGLDIHERYALVFGYRYLNVNYDKNDFLFDTAMKGPLFGFTIKF